MRIFDQLNGLKSVHIIDCLSLNNYFAQQIINLTKPFKLKSLSIREISESEIESLKLLIQKSCDYLENFGKKNYQTSSKKEKKLKRGCSIIFEQLNVLESVHLINCNSLNTGFSQQVINLTKPLKLKSLFIQELGAISEIDSLQLLIQKSCDYLENFGYDCGLIYPPGLIQIPQAMRQLFELIVKHCKNIKFLDLNINDNPIIYPALNLIENIKHNLNYLTISIHDNNGHNSIILQKLGKIIPLKLEYLHLYLYYIKAYDFEVFLKSSQDTFTKKLLISNITKGQDILPSIKTYIMKKRRVKYLAINGALFRSEFVSDELFSLEDEVKEFMLYDIKVKSYYGLAINMDDFMKEVI
ncbi:hypothetical protein RhiirA1_522931 [Rhizophagus irregularis]|uniref:F-box domain-containing protein n=1 Tax=Rhizophagus irregularis TaxID=588596 RepID=A0A2N0RFJ9_9GLOM|nr:hypothetical protein RhiirA1_522931 [Rhizophagus irregularis]